MKYCREKYQKKVEKKKAVTMLVEELFELNPSAYFVEVNNSTISTDLYGDKLGDIKIPDEAKFLGDESESCHYAFVDVLYNSKKITILNEHLY